MSDRKMEALIIRQSETCLNQENQSGYKILSKYQTKLGLKVDSNSRWPGLERERDDHGVDILKYSERKRMWFKHI